MRVDGVGTTIRMMQELVLFVGDREFLCRDPASRSSGCPAYEVLVTIDKGTMSSKRSCLHSGHCVDLLVSQMSIHSAWYSCLHDRILTLSSSWYSVRQIEQDSSRSCGSACPVGWASTASDDLMVESGKATLDIISPLVLAPVLLSVLAGLRRQNLSMKSMRLNNDLDPDRGSFGSEELRSLPSVVDATGALTIATTRLLPSISRRCCDGQIRMGND